VRTGATGVTDDVEGITCAVLAAGVVLLLSTLELLGHPVKRTAVAHRARRDFFMLTTPIHLLTV
jgi:hypothetical protein